MKSGEKPIIPSETRSAPEDRWAEIVEFAERLGGNFEIAYCEGAGTITQFRGLPSRFPRGPAANAENAGKLPRPEIYDDAQIIRHTYNPNDGSQISPALVSSPPNFGYLHVGRPALGYDAYACGASPRGPFRTEPGT